MFTLFTVFLESIGLGLGLEVREFGRPIRGEFLTRTAPVDIEGLEEPGVRKRWSVGLRGR